MLLYRSADLLFGSRIHSTAEALDIPVRPCRTAARLTELLAQGVTPAALIVEIDESPDPLDLITTARSRFPHLPIIAFGPHVNTAGLSAAAAAGAEQVMPRGAFAAALPEILRQFPPGKDAPSLR